MKKKLFTMLSALAVLMMLAVFAVGASAADGSNFGTAKSISLGTQYNDHIAQDEEDYFKFTLGSSGRITFKITSYMKYYCAVIYDANGIELWYTDFNEWISTTGRRSDTYTLDFEKGTYYLKINGYEYDDIYASTGNYNFTVSFESAGANIAEPNNNISQAKKISFNSQVKGQIAINDKDDYYKFTLSSAGKIKLSVTSYMQYYCAVIYDADGIELWYTDFNEWISTTGKRSDTYTLDFEKGTYYLKINGYEYDDIYASTGNYNFTVSFESAGANIAEPNNNISQAKKISFNSQVKGQIAINDKDDYYKFTLSSAGKIKLSVTSYMQYYCAVIYNADGNEVWYTDDNEWISTTQKRSDTHIIDLAKGTYYLKINGYEYDDIYASTGNYNFTLGMNITVPKVTSLKATQTTSTIKLSWKKASGVSGYRVYKYDAKTKKNTKIADTTATSYTVKKLKAGTAYSYTVKAYKKVDGAVYWGAGSSVLKTATAPANLSKLTAKLNKTTVTLTWSKVSGASGYRVYRYDSGKKTYVKIADSKSTSAKVKNLKAGKTYKLAVRPFKTAGGKNIFSSSFKTVSVSIKSASKPATPKLKVTAGSKKAALSWSKISGATGYQVYMATSKNGKYSKITTVKKVSTVKYTKTGLTRGKTYYFKVRAYKTSGGSNIYGSYSNIVSAKIK